VPLDRLSLHEAAHAVIALAAGVAIPYAITGIDAVDVMVAGRTWRVCPQAPLETQVVILLAGGVAERRHYGFAELEAADWTDARSLLAAVMGCQPPDAAVTGKLLELDRLASESVQEHWPWIAASAQALLRWRALTSREIQKLRPRRPSPTMARGAR
jgi:hypothetical protein